MVFNLVAGTDAQAHIDWILKFEVPFIFQEIHENNRYQLYKLD